MTDPSKELSDIVDRHPWLSILFGKPSEALYKHHPHFCRAWNIWYTTADVIFDIFMDLIILEIFLGFFFGIPQYITKLDIVALIWAVIVTIINMKYIKRSIIWIYKNEITKIYHPKSYWTAEFNSSLSGIIWDIIEIIGYALTIYLIIKYAVIVCIHPVIMTRIINRTFYIIIWTCHQI